MASITITASMLKSCSKHQFKVRPPRSFGTKQAANHIVTLNIQDEKGLSMDERQQKAPLVIDKSGEAEGELEHDKEREEAPELKFFDSRWKEGTWDLNMFVKNGKMDWDGVIVAGKRDVLYMLL